jgi:hypothetical protein
MKKTDIAAALLGFHLEEIHKTCRAQQDPMANGPTQWPSDRELDELSAAIRRLASLYGKKSGSTWSRILVVQNKRPSLKLKRRIEELVGRASDLYMKLPRAIEIQRQAKEGSETAKACFADLRKCFNGQAGLASIHWDQHDKILAPRAAKGENCRDKAAQICLDWLRWDNHVGGPALSLKFWLVGMGNLRLARKLDHLGSTHFFDEVLKNRHKKGDALRQKKHRLRKRELKLVQEELGIIDSPGTPRLEREAAEKRLIDNTHYTADEWRRFFVKERDVLPLAPPARGRDASRERDRGLLALWFTSR